MQVFSHCGLWRWKTFVQFGSGNQPIGIVLMPLYFLAHPSEILKPEILSWLLLQGLSCIFHFFFCPPELVTVKFSSCHEFCDFEVARRRLNWKINGRTPFIVVFAGKLVGSAMAVKAKGNHYFLDAEVSMKTTITWQLLASQLHCYFVTKRRLVAGLAIYI